MKDQCCICLDSLVDTQLQCGHEFCQNCISEVLERDNEYELSCPLCRNPTFITSNPDINRRILDIELSRNENGTYYDWENIINDYVEEINIFNGDAFYITGSWYDILFGGTYIEIKYSRGSYYASSTDDHCRWTENQWCNPRWHWPSHKMSDYYKLYKTPQITD